MCIDKTKCINCVERRRCQNNFAAWIFFIIGMIAALAIRVVTVLMHFDPRYGKIAWYIGVIGFLAFFIYKFRLYNYRLKVIRQNALVDKVQDNKTLTQEERNVLAAMLCSLSSKKESINYLVIFILSALALVAAVYFDFIHK